MPRTPENFLVTSASLEAVARIQMALSVATPDLAALNLSLIHILRFTLDDGSGTPRTILSGIRKWYPDPQALVGKNVIAVINLKPRKMCNIESQGMILAAVQPGEDGETLSLLTSMDPDFSGGSEVG